MWSGTFGLFIRKNYDTDSLPKSELRKRKVKELKSQLCERQSFFPVNSKSKGSHRSMFCVSHVRLKTRNPWQKRHLLKQLTCCSDTLKQTRNTNFKQISTTIKMYSYITQWSHGRASLETHCGLRMFLTAVERIYRFELHGPIVHFDSDGVYQYDCKKELITVLTTPEGTHTRRGHISVFQ